MNKDYLSNLTPEQRLEMREKAKASKANKKRNKKGKLCSPVARHLHKFNKPSVQRDRTKYKRKPKHNQQEI